METNKKIRMGLIGCGGMMTWSHAPSLDKLLGEGQNFEITATCDLIKDRTDNLANRYGAKSYIDYHDMLDDVDAVFVATTHDVHFEIAHFFMSNNKHCLLEKPLCNTREEIVILDELAREKGVTFMCAYPVPYWEGVCLMRDLLATGQYGKITQMSIWTEQYTPVPMEIAQEAAVSRGGGQLFSHGCHYIDILLEFLGDPAYGVHIGSNLNTPWMGDTEGTSNVTLMFKNGIMAYHFGTWGARGSTLNYTFQIHTDEGMFDYKDLGPTPTLTFTSMLHPDPDKRREIVWKLTSTAGHATWREVTHFLECIEEKKEPFTNARRALRGLDVIWKLYDAEKKGEIADLSNI